MNSPAALDESGGGVWAVLEDVWEDGDCEGVSVRAHGYERRTSAQLPASHFKLTKTARIVFPHGPNGMLAMPSGRIVYAGYTHLADGCRAWWMSVGGKE